MKGAGTRSTEPSDRAPDPQNLPSNLAEGYVRLSHAGTGQTGFTRESDSGKTVWS
jgi:hypothetical protein